MHASRINRSQTLYTIRPLTQALRCTARCVASDTFCITAKVAALYSDRKCCNRATENAGPENAGLENDGLEFDGSEQGAVVITA